MIAVIFEVQIQPDQQTRYLTLAEELRPLLKKSCSWFYFN